jgi:hypothetical protein
MGVLFCWIDSPDGGDILDGKPVSVKSAKTMGVDRKWKLLCRNSPGHSVTHYPVLSLFVASERVW